MAHSTTPPLPADTVLPGAEVALTTGAPPDAGVHPDNPDLDRGIHLSKALRPRGKRARREMRHQNFRALVPVLRIPSFFMVGIAVTVATVVGGLLARLVGVNFWAVVSATIAASVGAWFWFMSTRALPRVPDGVKYPISEDADDRYRLRVCLSERQAHAILGTPLSNDPFEPRVFAVPLAMPTPAWPVWTSYLVLTIGLSIAWMFVRKRFMGSIGPWPMMGPWDFWAIMCVCLVPYAWTWPTYLRITPGRLEVMRYRFLGMGTPDVTSFDLRRVRLLIDLGPGSVQIAEPVTAADEPELQRTIVLSDWGPRWTDIARALLEAARFEGDAAAPLPKDALLG